MTSFDKTLAYWSFGWLPSDRLPGVAVELLEQGNESPSIIELASSESTANPKLHDVFKKVLAELGRIPPTRLEAGLIIAREYAYQICEGKLPPVEGARAIWTVSLECDELSPLLGIFGGRVTEYEGLSDGQERISELIVCEARKLLGTVS